MNKRSEALAARLEAGAAALAAFAGALSEAEWQTRLPKDGRKVGVVVHHVASVYPIEIHLASLLASATILVSRLERRSRQVREAPLGNARRNISSTC